MATYKTPGVYVEEISLFPPSVAQVETAIPAFIGYTEYAKEYADNDLLNVPKKIGSLLEYTQYYGGAPSVDIGTLDLNSQNQVVTLDLIDKYYLFESMRLFFANGGGFCYIVAVGKYGEPVANGDGLTPGFLKGLGAVRKVDEPTLLVTPDAGLMSQADMSELQKQMLTQCADLQDRFSIFDLRFPDEDNNEDFDDTVVAFRDGIGMNNLKYGAVYGPWVKSNFPRIIRYSDIYDKITQNGSAIQLRDLITGTAAQALADRLDDLTQDNLNIADAMEDARENSATVLAEYERLIGEIKASTSGTAKAKFNNLIAFYVELMDYLYNAVNTPTLLDSVGSDSLVTFLTTEIGASLTSTKGMIGQMIRDANEATGLGAATVAPVPAGYSGVAPQVYFLGAGTATAKIQGSLADYNSIWNLLQSLMDMVVNSAKSFASTVETSALEAIPALKTIFREISSEYLTLPPSGAIAGVYAAVDSTRGVWKAPANVSLNGIVGVTEDLDSRDQEGLNVDAVAGKSINALRKFTGKGILIWGARTLAGNDNEWRYISVRRFFNMVEESVKNASGQFVFEANDANTWVRIRGMIEAFLILQWKAGALAGAKPEQAFFVKVGLGQTMTAQDILEGRMNIEIGMAVVRPAEFIILKFSHKMQEA